MNTILNEYDIQWKWYSMKMIFNEYNIQWIQYSMKMIFNEYDIQWKWYSMNIIFNEYNNDKRMKYLQYKTIDESRLCSMILKIR